MSQPLKPKARQAAGVEFNPLSQHRRDAELEAWICKRLKLELFLGTTTTQIRRDRPKVVLIQRELVDAIAGKFGGKAITWRALFKQLYGEEL